MLDGSKKHIPLYGIIVTILLPCVFVGIVYVFIVLVVESIPEHLRDVTDVLKEIPKEPNFYYFVAAIIGGYVGVRWWMFCRFQRNFEDLEDKSNGTLRDRDWNVAQELRKRALVLRMRADLILGAGFLLVLAGMYFTIFILREIVGTDPIRITQIQFTETFSDKLDCVFEGKCWINVDEELQIPDQVDTFDAEGLWTISTWGFGMTDRQTERPKNRLQLEPGESVTAVGLSTDGTTGLVGTAVEFDTGGLFGLVEKSSVFMDHRQRR